MSVTVTTTETATAVSTVESTAVLDTALEDVTVSTVTSPVSVAVGGGPTVIGGGTLTAVVASSTATAKVKAAADYVCDGTADQTEINAALAAIGNDGHLLLSEGDFSVTAGVVIQSSSVTVSGAAMGSAANASSPSSGTRIIAAGGFSGSYVLSVGPTASETQPVGFCQIEDLTVDVAGVSGVDGIRWTCHSGKARNVRVVRARDGWTFKGATGAPSWNLYDCEISGCQAFDNTRDGFVLGVNATDMMFDHCIAGRSGQDGLHITSGSGQMFTTCHFYDSTRYNGHLEGAGSYSEFTGCRFDNNQQHGLVLDSTLGNVYIVRFVGCWFNRAGLQTTNTYSHVHMPGSGNFVDGVSFVGCQFFWQGSGNKAKYAINTFSGWTRNCRVRDCYFEPNAFATAVVNDGGTNNVIAYNDANQREIVSTSKGTNAGYLLGATTSDKIALWGGTPTTRPSAYTPTNVTTDRSFDANATTIDELADVLGTLIADFQSWGAVG